MINASTALRSPLISRSVAGLIWRGLHHQRPQTTVRYRRLSNISNSEATSLPPPPASASTSAVAVDAVPTLVRHGPGDGVITLNVGGTEFLTLRSTVDINPVLRNYVIRAEANKEFTNGCAVFIDRDPTHFSLILQHLRNKADSVNVYSSMSKFSYLNKYGQVLVQIPKDKGELRDLFVEARHYKIKELEDVLCKYDTYTQLANILGGEGGNPFHTASQVLMTVRRALLATGGVGVLLGTQNEELMEDVKEFFSELNLWVRGGKKDKNERPTEPSFA